MLKSKMAFKKKFILFSILFLVTAVPDSWCAITMIANTCANNPATYATTTTNPINTTGATLIVVAVSYYGPSGIITPTDSQGNTWISTSSNTPYLSAYGYCGTEIFYVSNPVTSATHTFTEANDNWPAVCVEAFKGTNTSSSPLDVQTGAGSPTSADTTLQTGNVTPNQSNEVVVTALNLQNYVISPPPTTGGINGGFELPGVGGQVPTVYYGDQDFGEAMAYFVQNGAPVAENPTWTVNNAGYMVAAIATFEASTNPASFNSNIQGSSTFKGNSVIH
jgi:hypothetical protein